MTTIASPAGLRRLFGFVGAWAIAFVCIGSVAGYIGRGWLAGATDTAVPIALAILVLVVGASTALPDRGSASRVGRVALVAVAVPCVVLPLISWLASHLVDGAAADGVFALGLAPAEIASVATVSLAAGDAVLAAATLAGSILVTTAVGPVVLQAVTGTTVNTGSLVAGLFLEVVLPFAVGLALGPVLRRHVTPEVFDGMAVLVVSVLAAMTASQLPGLGELPRLSLAAAIVVAGGYLIGLAIGRFLVSEEGVSVLLTSGMRDFAVAAALATAAFGASAAAAAAPFGVLVLVSGTAIASLARRRSSFVPPP